nr:MAG TPA: XIAP-associated factor 1 [Caudoviricetes sp.]
MLSVGPQAEKDCWAIKTSCILCGISLPALAMK